MTHLGFDLTDLEGPGTGVSLLSATAVGADVVPPQLHRHQLPQPVLCLDPAKPPHQLPGLPRGAPRPVPADGHIEAPPGAGGEEGAVPAPAAAQQAGVAGQQQVGQAGLGLPAAISSSHQQLSMEVVKMSHCIVLYSHIMSFIIKG